MIAEPLSLAIGAAAALAGWLIPRRVAGARLVWSAAVLLDLFPVLLATGLLLVAVGRPMFAGLVVLSLGGGFAFADRTKRETLREPIVFSDMSEFEHLFTHPHLYLPFAGPALVVGGALAAIGVGAALLLLTPALWPPDAALILAAILAVYGGGWLLSREPLLSRAAAGLRRLNPSGDPLADAATLGPFAALLVYGIIARAERGARRAPHRPLPVPPLPVPGPFVSRPPAPPVVLVQCESFFDARRISPRVPRDLLPGFDACLRQGATYGRVEIAAWGANTMRAEFAVLTGIAEEQLGYDRFNPYHAFARVRVASVALHLRARGYRTLCLHPFDRRFFRRDLIMPALGFDQFIGRDELGGGRRPPYLADPDLGRQLVRILDEAGPRTFIFAITMGNHGPWSERAAPTDALPLPFAVSDVPQAGALLRYLKGLVASDEMLAMLLDELGPRRRNALFGFYGDHQPSLPRAFGHFGFDDWASDYVLIDGAAMRTRRLDLPAHRLHWAILDRLRQRGIVELPGVTALGAA
jgi:hypothetical protein